MFCMALLSSNYIYDGGCLVFSGRKELGSLTITQTRSGTVKTGFAHG